MLTPDQIAAANAGSAQAAAAANAAPAPVGFNGQAAGSAPIPTNSDGTPIIEQGVNDPTTISRSIDPGTPAAGTSAAQTYLDTFTPPQSENDIAAQKTQEAQGLIDSTNQLYDTQVQQEQQAGQQRLNQNNSVSVLSGLMGSTDAARTSNDVTTANQKNIDAINNQRAVALQSIYGKISSDAETEAEQQKTDAQKSAEDVVARQTQSQTDAVNDIKQMAAGGLVDFDSFKNNPQNTQVYQYALAAFGGSEDAMRATFAANRPQDQLIGTPQKIGNTYVQAYKNPITGAVAYDTVPLPAGVTDSNTYNSFETVGGNIMAVPDNWDGDPSKLVNIGSSTTPTQELQDQGLELDNEQKEQNLKAGSGATTVAITDPTSGKTTQVPVDVAPYVSTSHSGVAYADLSKVQGTAAQKSQIVNEAQAAGIKVITNANTATDLFNISDANNKLDTVSSLLANIDQPSALSRDLAGGPLSYFATMAQTDPQKAAAGVLSSIGTDILKAMQGVQGSRMSAAAVANINKELPTIYDTQATVAQKVANLQALLSDRENGILGQPQTASGSSTTSTSADTANPAKGVDGTAYGFPGYVSDGTQWVPK